MEVVFGIGVGSSIGGLGDSLRPPRESLEPQDVSVHLRERNAIHIIDIRETVKGLLRAKKYIAQVVAKGEDVLFVGTKRQARIQVQTQAVRVGMPFVIEPLARRNADQLSHDLARASRDWTSWSGRKPTERCSNTARR